MNETLREYLDRIQIKEGDDSTFVVQEMFKGTEMQVSRRYLESAPWQHLLDYEIVDYVYPYTTIYGSQTIKLFIQEKKSA